MAQSHDVSSDSPVTDATVIKEIWTTKRIGETAFHWLDQGCYSAPLVMLPITLPRNPMHHFNQDAAMEFRK